jgi:hypothetical protein
MNQKYPGSKLWPLQIKCPNNGIRWSCCTFRPANVPASRSRASKTRVDVFRDVNLAALCTLTISFNQNNHHSTKKGNRSSMGIELLTPTSKPLTLPTALSATKTNRDQEQKTFQKTLRVDQLFPPVHLIRIHPSIKNINRFGIAPSSSTLSSFPLASLS